MNLKTILNKQEFNFRHILLMFQIMNVLNIFSYRRQQMNRKDWLLIGAAVILSIFTYVSISKLTSKFTKTSTQIQILDYYIVPDGNNVSIDMRYISSIEICPFLLVIQFKNHTSREYLIQNYPAGSKFQLDINKKEIQKAKIRFIYQNDVQRLQASSAQTQRNLQAIQTDYPFLTKSLSVFQLVFQISRNLIVIGLVTNLLDIFLPFIILSQSFLMLSMLNCDQHYLTIFFYNIFNSKSDLMNMIRLGISPGSDSNTLAPLAQYNFSTNIFYNISGQLFLVVIFIGVNVLISFAAACISSQSIRAIKTKFRPLWNALLLALLPRIATFVGFHIRMISSSGSQTLNILLCGSLCVGFIVYFVQLLVQIRRINSRIQYIDESRTKIGLVSRINYKKQFQFDCLRYSMLYYPLMIYVRLLIFFLPIGASYDFYYSSFAGPIFSQLFMMMIQISSPGYTKGRDKFFYPLNNFLLITIQLCIITIGLAQGVYHPQVSEIAEYVLFVIASVLFGTSFMGILLDTIQQIKRRASSESKSQEDVEQNVATQKFVKGSGKFNTELNDIVKREEKTDYLQDHQQSDLDYNDQYTTNKVFKTAKLKIKKIRRGKII